MSGLEIGEKRKHIILARNSSMYTTDVFDIDYTSISTSWMANVVVVNKAEVPPEVADQLLRLLSELTSDRGKVFSISYVNRMMSFSASKMLCSAWTTGLPVRS